nr:DUF551 domain-containing protein [Klebsiella quasipneumoniae]
MTKSTITRERLEQLANFKGAPVTRQEEQELARIALAAMDSKPDCNERQLFCSTDTARMKKVISVSAGSESTPLYRHAQPAPASEPVYQYWCYTTVENSEGDPEEFWFWKDCEKDFYDRWKNAKRTLYKTPQPAPVVPDGYVMVPEEPTESMVIAGFESEPDEFFSESEVWEAYQKMSGCEQAAFRARLCWRAMLAAAPQSPGSEPATVPGKWIPVSERMPESNGVYFGWDGKRVLEVNCFFGGFSANQFIHGEITHWMPLPAGPQEVR